jgi:hypothetical protein
MSFAIDPLTYTIIDSANVYVSGFQNQPSPWDLSIPSSVSNSGNTYNVVYINNAVFANNTDLINVVIPNSITLIQYFAFGYCANLTSVSIHGYCSILNSAFTNCTALSSFTYNYSYGIPYPPPNIYIDQYAFYADVNLNTINIPSNVTSIGIAAFGSCSNLTSVYFLESTIPTIASDSFSGIANPSTAFTLYGVNTSSLQTLGFFTDYISYDPLQYTIISSTSNVYVSGFQNNPSPWELTIPSSVSIGGSTYTIVYIGANSLYTTDLISVVIPSSVTEIKAGAFSGCQNLNNVSIDGSCIIDTYAFSACNSLIQVNIPHVLDIGTESFLACNSLSTITIPASTTSIGDRAFKFDSSLISVYFAGSSLPSIGSDSFASIGTPSTAYTLYGVNNSSIHGLFTYYSNWGSPPIQCFKEDTKILCFQNNQEVYLPIRDIRKGTLVKTLSSGYKCVEMIGCKKMYNPGNKLHSKDRLYKCTNEKYPEIMEDLYITGCHSILVDEITDKEKEALLETQGDIYITEDRYRLIACLDKRAEPYGEEGIYTIYHFALENENYRMNYGVYANGLLVESNSLRMMKEYSGMELI